MKVRESVAKLFSGSVVNAVVQFAAIAGFTRLLGTGPVGSFFVFQAVIGMVGIPADLGVSRAAEKRLSEGEPQGEVICAAALVKTLLVAPWLFGLVIAGTHVEQYIGAEGVLPFVLVGLLASQAQRLGLRLLAGQLRVEQNALLKVLGQVVWVSGGFALVHAGWGASAIIASFALGRIVTLFGVLVRMDLTVGWPRVDRIRDLLNFGRYLFVGNVGGYIYQWMDVAILRLFVPVSLIGAYEITWRVASLSILLTKAIRASLFPKISRWYADNQLNRIEDALYNWVQVPLYLTVPAFAGAAVLGPDILETVFEVEVAVASTVLLIFMLEKILRSVQLIIGPSLYAMDKPHLGYRGSAAAIVTNLVLNLTLIPVLGVIGAAIATTVGAGVAAVIAITYVNNLVTVRVPWSRIGWSVLSSVVMASGVFLLRASMPPGWLRLTVCVGTGIVVYFVLLGANESIRIELQGVIQEFRGS